MLLPNNSWPKSQRNNNRPSLAASTVCVYCRSCESCQDSSPVLGERVANLYKIECRHEQQLRLLLPPLLPLLMVKFLVSATRRRHTDANVCQFLLHPPPVYCSCISYCEFTFYLASRWNQQLPGKLSKWTRNWSVRERWENFSLGDFSN